MIKLSNNESDWKWVGKYRNGEIVKGLSTGFPSLDRYFVWKKNTWLVVNGQDNVGKSFFFWYLMVKAAQLHSFKFLVFTSENLTAIAKMTMAEFFIGKKIEKFTKEEVKRSYALVNEHFQFFDTDMHTFTSRDVLNQAASHKETWAFDYLFLDPFNSLRDPTSYDHIVKVCGDFEQFKKQVASLITVTHPKTESALRFYGKKNYRDMEELEGYLCPPEKGDTTGGSIWSQRCDDYITAHRIVDHPDRWMITELYIRKIKIRQLGGCPSPRPFPVEFRLLPGGYEFEALNTNLHIPPDLDELRKNNEKEIDVGF